jgi:hypothetical protein
MRMKRVNTLAKCRRCRTCSMQMFSREAVKAEMQVKRGAACLNILLSRTLPMAHSYCQSLWLPLTVETSALRSSSLFAAWMFLSTIRNPLVLTTRPVQPRCEHLPVSRVSNDVGQQEATAVAYLVQVQWGPLRRQNIKIVVDLTCKNYAQNIMKYFHLRLPAAVNSKWINASNSELLSKKNEGLLTNYHKANHSAPFHLVISSALSKKLNPYASTTVVQDADIRLAAAKKVIDEVMGILLFSVCLHYFGVLCLCFS